MLCLLHRYENFLQYALPLYVKEGKSQLTIAGGCTGGKHHTTAMVDTGDVHALMIGVGAAFDYEAGNIQRAPQWMQKHNLEWLYRLMQDPKRLFKRYLNTNLKYLIWTWRH